VARRSGTPPRVDNGACARADGLAIPGFSHPGAARLRWHVSLGALIRFRVEALLAYAAMPGLVSPVTHDDHHPDGSDAQDARRRAGADPTLAGRLARETTLAAHHFD
jgi:hypothetical protein